MFALVNLLFDHAQGKGKYLSAKGGVYFHNHETGNREKLSRHDIMFLIEYVVKNSYVQHAGIIFHQTKGIPMGGNASPLLADLCLSMLEYHYIMKHPTEARRLSCTMRYIDDILTLNTSIMKDVYHNIYDPSLPLSFDDTSQGNGHYLDLQLDRNTGSIDLYDKRNDFKFEVIRYTQANSNCPRTIGLNTLFAQLLRVARIVSDPKSLYIHFTQLINIFQTKGYSKAEISRTFHKFGRSHEAILREFGLHTKKLREDWLRTRF
jgi:hypothetical protein